MAHVDVVGKCSAVDRPSPSTWAMDHGPHEIYIYGNGEPKPGPQSLAGPPLR